MRIIKLKPLREYWERHPDAKEPLTVWYADAKRAVWRSPHDIKASYANASVIGNNRVVFNIKGNDYRLIVAVTYVGQRVLIKFVGTHAEYDKINAEHVEL